MTWTPTLPADETPLYEQLVRALADDVAAGVLEPGARLPAQRDLAFRLGLGLGTVTKAYAEAERRGLLAGHVGRGSFVAPPRGSGIANGVLDMARNLPPPAPVETRLGSAMARLTRRPDMAKRLGYAPSGGFEADRVAGARWLAHVAGWSDIDPGQVICTAGAQQAVAIALAAVCRPGDTVIAEAATFGGLKALAEQMDYRLAPAAIDGQGLTPDALDRAARETGRGPAMCCRLTTPRRGS